MKKIVALITIFITGMFMFTLNVSAEGFRLCEYSRNYHEGTIKEAKAYVYIYYYGDNIYKVWYSETHDGNDSGLLEIGKNEDRLFVSGPALKALTEKGQCPNRVFIHEWSEDEICIDNYNYNDAHHFHETSISSNSFCGGIDDYDFELDHRQYLDIDAFEELIEDATKRVEKISLDYITYDMCIEPDYTQIYEHMKSKMEKEIDELSPGFPPSFIKKVKDDFDEKVVTKKNPEAEKICASLIRDKKNSGEITEEQANEYIENLKLITFEGIVSELELSSSKYFKDYSTSAPICGIFGYNTWGYVQTLYKMIKLFIPAIIVLLGMVDFLKVLFSGEEKDMKTSGIKFMKRIIAGIIFILLPVLIEFLIHVVGFSENCLQQLFRISL